MISFYLQLIRILPLSILRVFASVAAFFINRQSLKGMLWKTQVNINLVYPDLNVQQQKELAHKSVTKQCIAYTESVKCWTMPPKWSVQQIRDVHRLEILIEALKQPNGTLVIVPHLGTWEMMNAWLHQFGTPTIMYKPMKNEQINQFVLQSRNKLNASLVPTDAAGVKALFKTLKQGGFSIILPDHVPQPSGGVIAPFFGIPCLTSTLTSKMAQKTQCKLVGITCIRREDNQGFDIYCDDLNDENLYNSNIQVATTALNQAVEGMINRFPADYMWGYKRFKDAPSLFKPYKPISN